MILYGHVHVTLLFVYIIIAELSLLLSSYYNIIHACILIVIIQHKQGTYNNIIFIGKNNFCLIKHHHWKVLRCTGSVLSRWSSLRGPAPAGQSTVPAAQ